MADRVGEQLGNYRLTRLLSDEGGFADVYLGEHIHLGTQAAIKVLTRKLTDDEIAQFRNEARTMIGLQHPNIVQVLDFGMQGRLPFIVMHYAPNGSLRRLHPRGTRLPLQKVLTYVKQVAAALQYAHNEGLVHRDVKPPNMLLGRRNEVLLSDFGIVAVSSSLDPQRQQNLAGTWAYMAPEQIQKQPRRASDQYSLGIVVYEWLTGAPPFEGAWNEIAIKHISVPPAPLRSKVPSISPNVEQVVLRALAKDPQQRFPTVQAFADALEQANMGGTNSYRVAAGAAVMWGGDPPVVGTPHVPLSSINSSGAMFGYDLAHTRFNPHEHILSPTNVSRLVPLWSAPTGGPINYSSPAVANGVVYVGSYFRSYDGKLNAFEADTGKPLWSAPTESYIYSSPAVANGVVYVGSYDSKLYAFEAGTGKLLWSAPTGSYIYSSPAVANGVVYVGSNDSKLYAFEAGAGKPLWSAPTNGGISSSPAVANGVVYVGSRDRKLYAFEAGTGKPLWSAATGNVISSSPAVANGVVYVGSNDGKLYAFYLP